MKSKLKKPLQQLAKQLNKQLVTRKVISKDTRLLTDISIDIDNNGFTELAFITQNVVITDKYIIYWGGIYVLCCDIRKWSSYSWQIFKL